MAARRVIIVRDMKNWRPQPLAAKHRHDPPAWARIQTNGNMKILGEEFSWGIICGLRTVMSIKLLVTHCTMPTVLYKYLGITYWEEGGQTFLMTTIKSYGQGLSRDELSTYLWYLISLIMSHFLSIFMDFDFSTLLPAPCQSLAVTDKCSPP